MNQVELHAPRDVHLRQAPRLTPGPDEILIAVARVGICGSDLHAYHGRHPFIQLPVVLGHEFASIRAADRPSPDVTTVPLSPPN
jgi:L-iditol 2-dehydrogenase